MLIRRRGLRNIGFLHQNHLKGIKIIIHGQSDSGKLTFKKDFCSLYETINVFCFEEKEGDGCNTYGVNDLIEQSRNLCQKKISPNL